MQNIELSTMRAVDPAAVDRDTLVDIRDVTVDTSLPARERSPQIGNPYCYKCGKYVVKVGFSGCHQPAEKLRKECVQYEYNENLECHAISPPVPRRWR